MIGDIRKKGRPHLTDPIWSRGVWELKRKYNHYFPMLGQKLAYVPCLFQNESSEHTQRDQSYGEAREGRVEAESLCLMQAPMNSCLPMQAQETTDVPFF